MIKENIKINYKPKDQTFGERERTLNFEIQKLIEFYNQKGYTVVDHKPVNKSSTHAIVEFVLNPIKRIR